MRLQIGNLYRSKTTHYFFPSKELLKACFNFDDASEAIFREHESEIGHLGTEDMFVLLKAEWLEEPGSVYQILLTDGRIGWIISSPDQFEEVKNQ